jgi:hypothetical protein
MHKSIYLLLICLLIFGCTNNLAPIEVKDKLHFGNYSVSPPKGYWYFPRKFPDKFSTSKDFFLITFWEDKAIASKVSALRKTASHRLDCPDSLKVFFNFSVTVNNYKKFDEFYNTTQSLGIKYDELPSEADILKSEANWSCKQITTSLYGIECISLGKNLVIVSVNGNSKTDVLTKISIFKQMIDSIEIRGK